MLCSSNVLRWASFEDIEALAHGLPMLSKRSYRIGSEQGIIVFRAAAIDSASRTLREQRYRWVVALETISNVEGGWGSFA